MAVTSVRSTRQNRLPPTGKVISVVDYDDGFIPAGSPITPRFVDNGDGIVTDRVTGLQWIKRFDRMYGGTWFYGPWTNATEMVAGYVVSDSGKAYACQVTHTSRPASLDYFTEDTDYIASQRFQDNSSNAFKVLEAFHAPITSYWYWEYGKAYAVGEYLSDSGNFYKCLVSHTSLPVYVVEWAGETEYVVGDVRIDSISLDNYVCNVAHTSGTGSFEEDRTAHPTYWTYLDNTSGMGTLATEILAHPTYWSAGYATLPLLYEALNPTKLVQDAFDATMAGDIADHPAYWIENKFIDDSGAQRKFYLVNGASGAARMCDECRQSGYSDWRLPNILELLTLLNFGIDYGAQTDRFFDAFMEIDPVHEPAVDALYCSSTTDNSYYAYTWSVDFTKTHADAVVRRENLSTECYVWPVRVAGPNDVGSRGPRSDSLDVETGTTEGGTAVVITGVRFAADAVVTFGGEEATGVYTEMNGTQIHCTTPAHAAGVVDVVVTNGDGRAGTKVGAFTFETPP